MPDMFKEQQGTNICEASETRRTVQNMRLEVRMQMGPKDQEKTLKGLKRRASGSDFHEQDLSGNHL